MSSLKYFKHLVYIAISPISELQSLSEEEIKDLIVVSATPDNGDLCIVLGKLNRFKVKPEAVSSIIVDVLNAQNFVDKAEGDKRYVTIFIDQVQFIRRVHRDMVEIPDEQRGVTNEGHDRTVYVEYSSPNIAKPFHVGHLRSTIIGAFLCRIHNRKGFNVVSENYLGDWGKQYGLLGVAYKKYGDAKELESNPIKHLFEMYVKINQDAKEDPTIHDEAREYFRKMEENDEESLSLWKKMRELSIKEYKKVYSKLHVQFDVYGGE